VKKIFGLSIILSCLLVAPAFCDQKIEAKNWQSVRKLAQTQLSNTLGDHIGQTVAVQFNFRGKDIHHIKPNWFEGSIWQPDGNAKKGFSNIRVIVAKKDLPAFESITTDLASPARLTVYGQVEHDSQNNFYFVHLFGRNAKVDAAGNTTITW
jgi:hypothetical protein